MDAWDHPTSATSGQVGGVHNNCFACDGFASRVPIVLGRLSFFIIKFNSIQFNSLVKVLLSLNF
jgi:hypothetical protein